MFTQISTSSTLSQKRPVILSSSLSAVGACEEAWKQLEEAYQSGSNVAPIHPDNRSWVMTQAGPVRQALGTQFDPEHPATMRTVNDDRQLAITVFMVGAMVMTMRPGLSRPAAEFAEIQYPRLLRLESKLVQECELILGIPLTPQEQDFIDIALGNEYDGWKQEVLCRLRELYDHEVETRAAEAAARRAYDVANDADVIAKFGRR